MLETETQSLRLLFGKHALVKGEDGKDLMDIKGFTSALEEDSQLESPLFPVLFSIANHSGPLDAKISFTDFLQFNDLLKKTHAEYEIAFRLFDLKQRGKISLSDFMKAWQRYTPDGDVMMDQVKSELLVFYFGSDGKRRIGFEELSQLLKGVQTERLRHKFKMFDPSGSGFVTVDDFVKIVKSVARHNLSPFVETHLPGIANLYATTTGGGGSKVSWATVIAFNNVIRQMDVVRYVASKAVETTGHTSFSKSEFLSAAHSYARFSIFTPMELEIIFYFAGLVKSNSSRVSLQDIDDMCNPQPRKPKSQEEKVAVPKVKHVDTYWITGLRQMYNFALGSVAGAIGATVVYPIDLVKTRMQNQRSAIVGELLYKNSLDCFKKVIKNEGAAGLYRGLGPQLVGVAPEKAIKLTMNDLVRSVLTKEDGSIDLWAEVTAGCVAGGSQVVFTNPLEIVKIRLQVQGEAKAQGRKSAIDIVKQLGLVGLYKGAGACLLRDIPFSGIYFTAYSHLKKDYFRESPTHKLSMLELLCAGAIAGMPAAYLTTPADVIKTRLQVEARKGDSTYTGIRHAFVTIFKEEGFKALFKGGPARIFRSSPQFGVTLMAYEFFKQSIPFPYDPVVAKVTDVSHDVGVLKLRNTLQFLRDIDYRFGFYPEAITTIHESGSQERQ